MWRHGAMASLGFLSLASHAIALPTDVREQHSAPAIITAAATLPGPGQVALRVGGVPSYRPPRYTPPHIELPRYDPPRIQRPHRPAPPPVFVPHYTQLETRTILDGHDVKISAIIWRDECGRWNVKASVKGERGCELPPIFSASLAVKSDRRWWRTDMDRDACDPRQSSFRVAAGPNWGCDSDARVCLHLKTPGGRRMIQWDNVRVD
ncbi:MAG: hypothetical protein WC718_14245 [Phycisphaerales bacterium]|jgi:hypothetical protein